MNLGLPLSTSGAKTRYFLAQPFQSLIIHSRVICSWSWLYSIDSQTLPVHKYLALMRISESPILVVFGSSLPDRQAVFPPRAISDCLVTGTHLPGHALDPLAGVPRCARHPPRSHLTPSNPALVGHLTGHKHAQPEPNQSFNTLPRDHLSWDALPGSCHPASFGTWTDMCTPPLPQTPFSESASQHAGTSRRQGS